MAASKRVFSLVVVDCCLLFWVAVVCCRFYLDRCRSLWVAVDFFWIVELLQLFCIVVGCSGWLWIILCFTNRSSLSHMFFKMGVSKNFAIFKKSLQRRCFPVNISKFLRISFYRTHPLAASIVSTKNILPDSQMLKTMTNITTNLEHIFLNSLTDKKMFYCDNCFINCL